MTPPKTKIAFAKSLSYAFALCLFLSSCSENKKTTMPSKDRVSTAYNNYLSTIHKTLRSKNINAKGFELLIRAYKAEEILEAWLKNKEDQTWKLIKTFPYCVNSGSPGPKRQEGDLQIPEGFYHVDRFNPKSKFHLSLGINYPNKSDLILGDLEKPGSDIFIHGGCQSVGCIAIKNEGIEYLYVLASLAKENRQRKIPVRIFPCRMNSVQLEQLKSKEPGHVSFWNILKVEDEYFEETKKLKAFSVRENGTYRF